MQTRTRLDEILERLHTTQNELQQEIDHLLAEKREQFKYRLHQGRVVFERGVKNWQKEHRTGIWRFLRKDWEG